jgi:hypothetical protein
MRADPLDRLGREPVERSLQRRVVEVSLIE